MRLIIAELTEAHHDCFETLSRIVVEFNERKRVFEDITLAVRKITLKKINTDSFDEIFRYPNVRKIIFGEEIDESLESPRSFIRSYMIIRKIRSEIIKEWFRSVRISRNDVVIFNTVEGYLMPIFYKIIRNLKKIGAKVIVVIHNVHDYYPEIVSSNKEWKMINNYSLARYERFVKKFKKFGEFIALEREKILRNWCRKTRKYLDGIILPALHIINPDVDLPILKIVTRLPDFHKINWRREWIHSGKYREETPRIIVPGAVYENLRNYDKIIQATKNLCDLNFEVVFLGSMKSNKIMKILSSSPCLQRKIITYQGFISEEEYQKVLMKAHYVLISMKYSPPYGKYKTTGGIGDAISAGVPILTTDEFLNDCDLVIKRESIEELLKESLKYIANEKYKEIALSTIKIIENFKLENLIKHFEKFIISII